MSGILAKIISCKIYCACTIQQQFWVYIPQHMWQVGLSYQRGIVGQALPPGPVELMPWRSNSITGIRQYQT